MRTLSVFVIFFMFISCNKESNPEPEELPKKELSLEEKIDSVFALLEPPIEYSYSREIPEVPPCKLIEVRFTATYETPEEVDKFYYEDGRLSKVEKYCDDKLSGTNYVIYEANSVKVLDSDSTITEEQINQNGLLTELIGYDKGEEQWSLSISYNNDLPNRYVFVSKEDGITVFDLVADRFGNILEAEIVWHEGKEPTKTYHYTSQYDDKFFPYMGVPYHWANQQQLGSINNEITSSSQIGDVFESFSHGDLLYNSYGFLKTKIEDSHKFIYTYQCEE